MKAKWIRVSRKEPCPVCEKPDWCSVCSSGEAVHCMRVESGHPVSNGGWLHRLADPLPPKPPPRAVTKKRDWTEECRRMFEHRQAARTRFGLAEQLGVSVHSLYLLRVGIGWDDLGREFSSWPSRDDRGVCIGYVRRYPGKRKLTNKGGSTGLFYVPKWYRHAGPILIVEGGSDVAACETHSLCAIGRFSNVGGARWIRPMLRKHAKGRRVIVIGEQDEKPEKKGTVPQCPKGCQGCSWCFPGFFGMVKVARELGCESLMVPHPWKDMRNLLTSGGRDEFQNRVGGL